MPERTARVIAQWDPEAGIWVAMSYDIPGLALGAPTKDDLVEKLVDVVPDLLAANETLDYDRILIDYIEQTTVDVPKAA